MGAISLLGLSACASAATEVSGDALPGLYLGVETEVLGDDLINIVASVDDRGTNENLLAYARCAAAQYAVFQGFAFLRHIRTTTDTSGGALKADAIYTLSPSLPAGSKTIDAEVTVADCVASGIPTV